MADLPPVASVSVSRFGGMTVLQEQVSTIDNVAVTRLPNNPNRFRIAFLNEGSYDVRISNTPDVLSTTGWLLPAAGGVIISDWNEEGEIVTYDWYLIAVTAASKVRIREVIRS